MRSRLEQSRGNRQETRGPSRRTRQVMRENIHASQVTRNVNSFRGEKKNIQML
ncbi:unnamed protein product, partial [Mycena citricolor]